MTPVITIVLIDDHQILRQGVRHLLEDEADLEVIGEAADGESGIELVEKLKPDVLVSDVMMKGLTGIDVIRAVRKCSPNTNSIILSMYDDPGYVAAAMSEGAMGYVIKGSGIDELLAAIRQVASGGQYLCSRLRR